MANGVIYTLLLEDRKIYVGYSEIPLGDRFMEYFIGEGAEWTKRHQILQVLSFKPGTRADLDNMTLELMGTYGWWNVRGGQWCQADMTSCPPELLQRQRFAMPIPRNCGSARLTPDVYNPVVVAVPAVSEIVDAMRDMNLRDNIDDVPQIDIPHIAAPEIDVPPAAIPPIDDFLNAFFQRDNPQITSCTRCGRTSHTKEKCYARTTSSGASLRRTQRHGNSEYFDNDSELSDDSYGSRRTRSGVCYRCRRSGHYSSDCWASTDKYGNYL